MASYTPQYYSTSSAAVAIPTKPRSTSGYHSGGSTYSVSPPSEGDEQDRGSATSGMPSYARHGGSTTSGGYATTTTDGSSSGVAADYYNYGSAYGGSAGAGVGPAAGYYHHDGTTTTSAGSASGLDFNEYIQDRFAERFDPIPLDRSLARQAQTSGQLNAKHRELLDLQAQAQARLARTRARFQEGLQDAQEVRANLEWTSKKVSSLKKKTEKKHSKEYKMARERYPSPDY